MSSIVWNLFFAAILTTVNSASLQTVRNDICRELCQFCGGEESLLENICVCSLPQQALDQVTLMRFKTAQLQADFYHFPLLLQLDAPGSDQPPTANHITKEYIRRQKRNVMSTELSHLGAPVFEPNTPNGQTAVYEFVIGNNNDDSVQLMFPESAGVDVKHQFLYETPDGFEYPFSEFVQESSYSEEYSRELEPVKKNFNKLTGHKMESNNYATNLNRMMDAKDDLSSEGRNESEEQLWSSETTNTAARIFRQENDDDGYDQFNMDYGTLTNDEPTIKL